MEAKMKLAIVGSRNLSNISLGDYIKWSVDEIVSGGAEGVDRCAAEYARANNIRLIEFLPKYERYGRAAPLVRNKEIVNYADCVIVFWNGISKGTLSVIKYAQRTGKPCKIIICK